MKFALNLLLLVIGLSILVGITTLENILPSTEKDIQPKECKPPVLACWDGKYILPDEQNCTLARCPERKLYNLSIKTEKPIYKSSEIMWINVSVYSENGANATIFAHGILAKNAERLKKTDEITLKEGLNRFGIKYVTPPCTGCAGIKPGNYSITVEISVKNWTVTDTYQVGIKQ